jgi:biotin carboxyl carrier protein
MRYSATIDGVEHEIEVEELDVHKLRINLGAKQFDVDLRKAGAGSYSLLIGNRAFDFEVNRDGDQLIVAGRDGAARITLLDHARRAFAAPAVRQVSGRVTIKALMPGRVVQVLVKPGDEVEAGQGVLIVEAMKMENEVKAPKAGKVLEVKVAAGQTVEKGDILAIIE